MIRIEKGDNGRIIFKSTYNPGYIAKIKDIGGYRWYPEEKYWSVPSDNGTLKKLLSLFDGERIYLDSSLQSSRGEFEDLRRELVSRKYSTKTIKAYVYYNKNFLEFIKKASTEVINEDIKDFLVYLSEQKEVSTSSLNIAINALKFYYGEVLKREFMYEIKRPKKDKKLPIVLSREEVKKVFSSITNLKHKAILMLTYSAGLRVGEVVRLKIEDIDAQRKLIHIRGAKGRKDRHTILSEVALRVLKEYLEKYQPEKWLFCGALESRHISTRTVQAIFEQAKERAYIQKDVTVHSLRHSFATHLLESGTDIRYIQELLGHKNLKTTELYTYVSTKSLGKIRSPLDEMNLEEITEIAYEEN
jgi:site-specific recombinase XerD